MKRQKSSRAGSILICVLTCLLIVGALAVAMVKSALTARKAVRLERQQAQVEFFIEAGIQRAVSGLARDADYSGETWNLPAAALSDSDSARVEIAVTAAEEDASRTISVIAQFPAASSLIVRRSHTFTVSNEE